MTPWMDEHLALGYGPAAERLPWISIPAYDPAGGLKSTTNDLLAYVAANIDAHLGTRTDSVGRAMALAHRVHYQQVRANESPILMGLNWFLNAGEADTLIWHGGGSGSGYATIIGFIPSRRMGVVVLTNSAKQDAYELGFHLLDPSRRPPISTPQRPRWKQPAFIVTLAGVAVAVALVAWRWRR
jgi:beta-lactamase class C